MKLTTMAMAGISVLFGLTSMSTVIAAEQDGDRRPAFEGQRGAGGRGAGPLPGLRRGPPGARLERQLERMDTNDDGQISEEEFVELRLARVDDLFERRDRDDDGLIALDENQRPDRPTPRNRRGLDREELIACV